MGVIGEKRGREREREASPDKKTRDADGELLQEERGQRSEEPEPEGEKEGKPKGWIVAEIGCELETDGKTKRGDEEPEEPPNL